MKKIQTLLGIVILSVLVSCNSQTDVEKIKEEIKGYKKEVKELTVLIDSLQKILDTVDVQSTHSGVPIESLVMKPQTFKSFFIAAGSVEADNDAFISPEMNGQIKKIFVKKGERVQQGQLLVTLSTAVIDNTIAEIEKRLELANEVYEKQDKLWKDGIGSEIQYLQAKNNKEALEKSLATARSQRELSIIKAPFSGIVDDIFFKEGEMAAPGVRLIQLVNLKKLKIVADISESFLPKIHTGDTVEVSFPTYPDIIYRVPVNRIGNVVKPENRTFVIELLLENRDELLKPNIVASLKINDFTSDSAFIVPSIIIKDDNTTHTSFIFKATKKGDKYVAKKITIEELRSYKSHSMVNGIELGDTIIIKGDVTNNTEIFFQE